MLFIENARIITGEPGEVITGGRILIEGNLIAAVGADLARPAATQIGRASVGKECRSRWSPYH